MLDARNGRRLGIINSMPRFSYHVNLRGTLVAVNGGVLQMDSRQKTRNSTKLRHLDHHKMAARKENRSDASSAPFGCNCRRPS